MTSFLKTLVLYCALIDLAHVTDLAGQTQDLHQQLTRAARELSGPTRATDLDRSATRWLG